MSSKSFLLILIFLNVSLSRAQSPVGFWAIERVEVGEELMTPVARWTRISEDGTYVSGNGWTQNFEGTCKFDPLKSEFMPFETNGIKESFGAFNVEFSENLNSMTWEREEEGMLVKVYLRRVDDLPKSISDNVVGLWKPIDSDQKNAYLFIRWDKIYVTNMHDQVRKTGYWYFNAHKPEITFLPMDHENDKEIWKVEIEKELLKLTCVYGTSKGTMSQYVRIEQFP